MAWKTTIAENLFFVLILIYVLLIVRFRWRIITSRTYQRRYWKVMGFWKTFRAWVGSLGKKRLLLNTLLTAAIFLAGYRVYARLSPDKRFHRLVDGCQTLVAEKKYDQAVIDMTNALRIRPDYIRGHYFLSVLYLDKGLPEKAEPALWQVVRRQADYEKAPALLKKLLQRKKDVPGLRKLARQVAATLPAVSKTLEAQALVIEGKMEPALAILRDARQKAPKNTEVLRLTGDLLAMAGRPGEAAGAYLKAIDLDFGLWQAHFGLARVYLGEGKSGKALEELSYVRSLKADFSPPAMMSARIHYYRDEQEQAAGILEHLLVKEPGHPEALLLLGRVHLAAGNDQDAINRFDQLPEPYADHPERLYSLALAYLRLGKFEQAHAKLEHLKSQGPLDAAGKNLFSRVLVALNKAGAAAPEKASDRDRPTDEQKRRTRRMIAEARVRHGDLEGYLKKKDYQRLIAGARQAVKENRIKAPFYNLLGVAHLALGKPGRAESYFILAYQEAPAHSTPLLNLVNLYVKTGRANAAAKRLENHNRRYPDDSSTRLQLARLYLRSGRLDAAKGLLGKVIAMAPDRFQAHQQLGVIHGLKGEFPKAVEAYRHAIRLNPDDAVSLNDLANIFAENGLYPDTALEYATRAVALRPRSGNLRDTLGRVLYQRGDFEKARTHFQAARELNPFLPVIPFHLALAEKELARYREAEKYLRLSLGMKGPFPEIDAARALLEKISGAGRE